MENIETYDEMLRRLRRELKACGSKNVVVTLKDGKVFKARYQDEVESAIDLGCFYYSKRNAKGQLYISEKVGLQKIAKFEADHNDYPTILVGVGGHAE